MAPRPLTAEYRMSIGKEFLKEIEAEMKASRRLVERVPSEKVRWKPHPKSAALGHLIQLVCRAE